VVEETSRPARTNGWKRYLFLALGFFFTGLGIIGAFVPIMPTTIFLLVAVSYFARSSERLERWLLDHPRFGPPMRAWRDHGVITKASKRAAFIGMAAGYVIFWLAARPTLPLALIVGAFFLGSAWFVGSRPSRPADTP
jgi:uncharacterized membrane protein YbaN (DUF454 family)